MPLSTSIIIKVNIYPFNDGNGRMSRLLTTLEIGTGLAVSCFPTIHKPRPYCDLG
ncbi:MAG: Fic family protein [Lachnospiraceae bacterium]|nr:Fic family protein [Lachnospiraceae bacterium]